MSVNGLRSSLILVGMIVSHLESGKIESLVEQVYDHAIKRDERTDLLLESISCLVQLGDMISFI